MGDPATVAVADPDQPFVRSVVFPAGNQDPLLDPFLPVLELARLVLRLPALPFLLEALHGGQSNPWPQVLVGEHVRNQTIREGAGAGPIG